MSYFTDKIDPMLMISTAAEILRKAADQERLDNYRSNLLRDYASDIDLIILDYSDAEISFSEKHITIPIPVGDEFSPYDISLETINSHEDLLRWVHHLSLKSWATTRILNNFIKKVYLIKGCMTHHRNQLGTGETVSGEGDAPKQWHFGGSSAKRFRHELDCKQVN